MMEVQVPRAHWGVVDKVAMVEVSINRMEKREEEEKEGEEREKEEEREEKEGKMEKKKEGETVMAMMMMMMMMMMKVLKRFRLKKKTSRMRRYSTILLEWKTPESDPHCQQVQFPAPLPHRLQTQYRTVKQCQ